MQYGYWNKLDLISVLLSNERKFLYADILKKHPRLFMSLFKQPVPKGLS